MIDYYYHYIKSITIKTYFVIDSVKQNVLLQSETETMRDSYGSVIVEFLDVYLIRNMNDIFLFVFFPTYADKWKLPTINFPSSFPLSNKNKYFFINFYFYLKFISVI